MSEHIYVSLNTRRSLFIDEEEKKIYNTRRKREREREREREEKEENGKKRREKKTIIFVCSRFFF